LVHDMDEEDPVLYDVPHLRPPFWIPTFWIWVSAVVMFTPLNCDAIPLVVMSLAPAVILNVAVLHPADAEPFTEEYPPPTTPVADCAVIAYDTLSLRFPAMVDTPVAGFARTYIVVVMYPFVTVSTSVIDTPPHVGAPDGTPPPEHCTIRSAKRSEPDTLPLLNENDELLPVVFDEVAVVFDATAIYGEGRTRTSSVCHSRVV